MTSKLDTAGLVVEQLRAYAGNSPDDYRNRAADLIEALKRERDELLYLQSEVEAGDRIMQQRLEVAEARVAKAEQCLKMIAATADGGHANGHWHGVCYKIAMEYLMGWQAKLSEKDHATINRNLPSARAALAHKGEGRS